MYAHIKNRETEKDACRDRERQACGMRKCVKKGAVSEERESHCTFRRIQRRNALSFTRLQ